MSSYNVASVSTYTSIAPSGAPSNTVAVGVSFSETRSGVTRRKPQGWIPPTPYSMVHKVVTYPTGVSEVKVHPTYNWSKISGCVGSPSGSGRFNGNNHFDEICLESVALDPGSLANSALIAARNNLKGSSINLGVAFGERKLTAKLVGDTATRLVKSLRQLRRGHVRNAMNELGITSKKREPRGSNVPNKWLELQYGWKPLLSDVYGACNALSKRGNSDWSVTAKGYKRASDSWKITRTPYQWGNFDGFIGTASVERSALVRIDAIPNNAATIALASLGVTNPLVVAWELVPFSFVVDWFYPVGSYLESLDAMLGYSSAYTSTSVFQKAEWSDVGNSNIWDSNHYIKNSWSGTKKIVSLVRSASSGVPFARPPALKDGRSLGHMANGLALLSQFFGRK